jgi:BirA family biotin operon repressor/biotin-[acetyl-CoA-carboxylase] ligase
VIGIGINVAIAEQDFPADLRWPATSIGGGIEIDAVRDAVSLALGEWVETSETAVLDAFRKRDALSGREVEWEASAIEAGRGVAAGIDERGNIVVEREDGERLSLGSGEVSLRPG